jgi:hypothetical protein
MSRKCKIAGHPVCQDHPGADDAGHEEESRIRETLGKGSCGVREDLTHDEEA